LTRKGMGEEEEKEEEFTSVTAIYSKPTPEPARKLKLEVGDHVQHRIFGDGVVINCSLNKDDQELTIAFEGVGVKRLLLSLAPLEKVEKN